MINTVTLVGNITSEGKYYSNNGLKVYSNSIAFTEIYKKEKRTQFIKFKCFYGFADFLNKRLRKGARVTLLGSLSFEEYTTKNNEKRKDPVIILQTIDIQGKFYSNNEFENGSSYTVNVSDIAEGISDDDFDDLVCKDIKSDKIEEKNIDLPNELPNSDLEVSDMVPVDEKAPFDVETTNVETQSAPKTEKQENKNIFLAALGL
ncbi:single-stranded DNA-binding protein [Clostridium massiliamazoniense]|uniref:single-stranded DNA-binding protein n=1 Tax=Clostridium massiliamazoniense TaxID=1347366 RepID=UPI0006D799F3|nr:single-stranded DNA-binding protein [Clostridium massiliamazoniense]